MTMKAKLVLFSNRDRRVMRAVARLAGVTESELIRLAVRWYAVHGPWRYDAGDLPPSLRIIAAAQVMLPPKPSGESK